jgi:Rad3-related DNA helicase
MSFYLYTMLFSREFDRPAGLVVDEAHRIAEVVRGALSYDITDWHLSRSIKLLKQLGCTSEAKKLEHFLEKMIQVLRKKRSSRTGDRLLSDSELLELMGLLKKVSVTRVEEKVSGAISSGKIDLVKDRDTLKQMETVARALPRYIRSLEYATETSQRKPLNFVTFGYADEPAKDEDERVNYKLVVEANYVVPIVRKMMGELTIAYSATIGDGQVFGYETGIQFPFHSLPGQFPAENTRVFMPSDTPNLAKKARSRQEPTKVLRKVTKTCGRLGEAGERALVVTVSNAERDKFVWLCQDEGVDVITYGEGVSPREAIARFKDGEGTVLVGTSANYGEGIDLPEGIATATFFLRPGYPNPNDPRAQFELRRYGSQAWMVWNWRVMIEALQVRGRNVRSADDLGVTIFISQQFRRFLFGSLPEWLRSSYKRDLTLEQCEEEIMELLGIASSTGLSSAR